MVVLDRSDMMRVVVVWRGNRRQLVRRWSSGPAERGPSEWATFVRELFGPGPGVGPFEQTTLVAQLERIKVRERNEKKKEKKLTTLPGLRLDRRQVEVSVVQQLKHLRRTRSLSLVLASSV